LVNYVDILILASGGGSNAEAIVKYVQESGYSIKITAGCNHPRGKAGVYEKLEKLGIDVRYIPSPKNDFSALRALLGAGNNGGRFCLIVLAGYMRVLPADITERYDVLNIHPSILPFVYKGSEDAYRDAINNRDTRTGCTVHRATPDVDGGDRLAQLAFKIPEKITEAKDVNALREIGLAFEHALYPRIVINETFRLRKPLDMAAIHDSADDILSKRGLPRVTHIPTPSTLDRPIFNRWNSREK
jgi:phosphoribosylglycinamide formyltransferase-1